MARFPLPADDLRRGSTGEGTSRLKGLLEDLTSSEDEPSRWDACGRQSSELGRKKRKDVTHKFLVYRVRYTMHNIIVASASRSPSS